jgi:hypothetical protein
VIHPGTVRSNLPRMLSYVRKRTRYQLFLSDKAAQSMCAGETAVMGVSEHKRTRHQQVLSAKATCSHCPCNFASLFLLFDIPLGCSAFGIGNTPIGSAVHLLNSLKPNFTPGELLAGPIFPPNFAQSSGLQPTTGDKNTKVTEIYFVN